MVDEKPMSDPHSFVPTELYTPTAAELRARRKRSAAIAIALAAFMIFVFFTMLIRSGAI